MKVDFKKFSHQKDRLESKESQIMKKFNVN